MARAALHPNSSKFDHIKSKAAQLFSIHGYHAMSLRELAKAVNITPGAIYNHIDSKQELLYTLVLEALERRHKRLTSELYLAIREKGSALESIINGFAENVAQEHLNIPVAIHDLNVLSSEQRRDIESLLSRQETILASAIAHEWKIQRDVSSLAHISKATLRLIDGFFYNSKVGAPIDVTFLYSATRAAISDSVTAISRLNFNK